eukprot:9082165-Ditylum_brightwellii.AAC.1
MAMMGAQTHIALMPMLQKMLKNPITIIHHMWRNPTSVLQLVSDYLRYLGNTDACKLRAGS